MTAPDPRDAEIAALREEIAELRARIAALEDFVGLGGRAASAPPPDLSDPFAGAAPDEADAIEPGEPWDLMPPGAER
jgi:hypothetical protein